jgi:hypothetical protein
MPTRACAVRCGSHDFADPTHLPHPPDLPDPPDPPDLPDNAYLTVGYLMPSCSR